MNYGYGDFGNLSRNYIVGRKEFPEEAMDWIRRFLKNKNSVVLDLGCGTGIATRQLKKRGMQVVGSDKDELMIEEARKVGGSIEYFVAPAETLPFNDKRFDAVTAFSAFHWFVNEKAIVEIKRVLKNRGIFCVINKNDSGGFKKGFYEIIKIIIGKNLPEAKKNYDPANILSKYNFSNIQEKVFSCSEYFTKEEAMSYLQSVSIWNLVPEASREKALKVLENYCQEKMINGKVERVVNIKVVMGQN